VRVDAFSIVSGADVASTTAALRFKRAQLRCTLR